MSTSSPSSSATGSREVAVIGRAGDASCDAVASFLTQLGMVPAVMSPQPATGADASALDALEALRGIGYAIVLDADNLLEVGFLLGAIGRERTCFLAGNMAKFPMDEAGLWRLLLARGMKQAGLDVDLNLAI